MNFKLSPQPLDDNDPSSAAWGDWHTKLRFALNQSGLSFDDLTDVPPNLVAIAALTGEGFAVKTGSGTWALRDLVAGTGINITNPEGIAGDPTISNTGVLSFTITQPAAGITATNTGVVQTGNASTVLALANDLAALEGLGSTGIAVRSAADTWVQRTITGTANQITVTDGSGVGGNPTLSLPSAVTLPGSLTVTTNLSVTGVILASLGAIGAPSYSFTGDTNTGMWSAGADILTWSVGGVAGMQLQASQLTLGTSFVFGANLGAVGTPSYAFNGDLNTGIYSPGADIGAATSGGVEAFRWHSNGLSVRTQLSSLALIVDRLNNGSTVPSIAAGTAAAFLGNSAAGSPVYISLVSGNASVSGIHFADTDADAVGFVEYNHSTNTLNFGTSATSRGTVNSVGGWTINAPDSGNTLLVSQVAGALAIATSQALSGDAIVWRIANTSNTAASNSRLEITVAGSTAADAYILLRVTSNTDWSFGIDNSDSDALVLSNSTALGTNNRWRVSTTGEHSIPAPTSGSTLTLSQIDGANAISCNPGLSGGLTQWFLGNGSNTASSSANLLIRTAGSSAGDPTLTFTVLSATSYIMGIDNSDADSFVISLGTVLGTTNALRLSNVGEFTLSAPSSGNTLNLAQVANDANFGLIQSQSSSGITLNWSLANTSNTAGSEVVLNLAVGGGTASDPMLRFGVTGVIEYVMGIDNSDSDRFKIEYDASVLGSGQEAVGISTAGAVRFPAVSTTASAANAFLDSGASNNLLRSTSSIKFKRDIRDLTDQEAQMIYNMRPIMYKSKAKADDPNLEWYGLIAEELADIAPRLVHWNDKEPDGVQYERISVLMIHELKKMRAELDDLKRKMV